MLAVALLAAACTTSSSAHPVTGNSHPPSPAGRAAQAKATALARQGLLVPATYQAACANEGSICLPNAAGSIPAVLNRPLHVPRLRPGQACPASPGRPVNTFFFGGIALGTGPVRVVIGGAGDLRHGVAVLINPTNAPPWLGLKTLWFAAPAYQGPFIIRAKRLGRPGPVALGEGPAIAPLVVPPGPTVNGGEGWREAPGGLWVKRPGCYAWQVDGLTFSEVIIVHAVAH
jgi:hypothetical protein